PSTCKHQRICAKWPHFFLSQRFHLRNTSHCPWPFGFPNNYCPNTTGPSNRELDLQFKTTLVSFITIDPYFVTCKKNWIPTQMKCNVDKHLPSWAVGPTQQCLKFSSYRPYSQTNRLDLIRCLILTWYVNLTLSITFSDTLLFFHSST